MSGGGKSRRCCPRTASCHPARPGPYFPITELPWSFGDNFWLLSKGPLRDWLFLGAALLLWQCGMGILTSPGTAWLKLPQGQLSCPSINPWGCHSQACGPVKSEIRMASCLGSEPSLGARGLTAVNPGGGHLKPMRCIADSSCCEAGTKATSQGSCTPTKINKKEWKPMRCYLRLVKVVLEFCLCGHVESANKRRSRGKQRGQRHRGSEQNDLLKL